MWWVLVPIHLLHVGGVTAVESIRMVSRQSMWHSNNRHWGVGVRVVHVCIDRVWQRRVTIKRRTAVRVSLT